MSINTLTLMNSLSFCLFGNVLLFPSFSFLKDSFAMYSILNSSSFLQHFKYYYPAALWPTMFLLKNPMIILLEIPSVWWVLFSCCFQDCLFSLTVWLYCVSLFIVLGVNWDSCICISVSFLIFGTFLAIISSKSYLSPVPPHLLLLVLP